MAVLGLRNAGRRGPKLKVRLPDGSSCWLPLAWTSLGAPPPGAPRLVGEWEDFLALHDLVEALAARCKAGDGGRADAAAAGAAGVGGALAALADAAGDGPGAPGTGAGACDDADGGGAA